MALEDARSDLNVMPLPFISAWDPRATSSGSIDPLGALRAYNAMATNLLPGVTTVTTRVRYLSWVCAGLRLLDELPNTPRGGQDGRTRRQRILVWERLVALATGMYATSANDDSAWSGLRGVSYVKRALGEQKCSVDFPLLKNQAGVGGVGTYWVGLISGGLVDDASAGLTTRGVDLAEAFLARGDLPRKDLSAVLASNRSRFSREELVEWGRSINLSAAGIKVRERELLADALLQPAQHLRVAAALGDQKHATSDHRGFKRLHRRLKGQRETIANNLAAVTSVVQAFEAIHTPLLDCFDRLRSANIHGAPVRIGIAADLVGLPHGLKDRGDVMQQAINSPIGELPPVVASNARDFLAAIRPILQATTADDLTKQLVRHHERVQGGKLDASRQPKQPWVALIGDREASVQIAPRFALGESPLARPEGSFTHPYRVEAFAGMLTEVDGWQVCQ